MTPPRMADVVGMGKSKGVKKVIEQKEKDWMMEMLEKVKVEMKDVVMGVVELGSLLKPSAPSDSNH